MTTSLRTGARSTFRRFFPACCVAGAALSLACSSQSTNAQHESVTTGASSPDSGSRFGTPFRLSITVPNVPPNFEGTKCLRAYLGNDAPVKIGKIHDTLSASSHHLVVSGVDDPTMAATPLFECQPFRSVVTGAPLAITQKKDDVVLMPEGVGYALAENQLIHLELHYINLTDETKDVSAETALFPIADPDNSLIEASFLVVGDLDIAIPPHSKHSTGPVYQPVPEVFDGVNFYAMTGHTHEYGTNVQVGTAESATAAVTPVYAPAPFNWAEPEMVNFSPPMHVPIGGGFSYQCDWNNTTNAVLKFGESALEEMCFFWAYYYPKKDASRTLLQGVTAVTGGEDGGAATLNGTPCAKTGDPGNSRGVGRYCAANGNECSGAASICLAEFTRGTFGDFCSLTCANDSDCGEGASCVGDATPVCIPTSCVATLGGTYPRITL